MNLGRKNRDALTIYILISQNIMVPNTGGKIYNTTLKSSFSNFFTVLM